MKTITKCLNDCRLSLPSRFRRSLLGESPDWLRKWAAITLRQVVEENEKIKENVDKYVPIKLPKDDQADKLFFYTIETQSLLDLRVQNMAISIDKINLFFRKNMSLAQKSKSDKVGKKVEQSKVAAKSQNGIFNFVRQQNMTDESPERPKFETSPFYLISPEEDEEFYWGKKPESLRLSLSQLLNAASSKATTSSDRSLLKDLMEFLETKIANLPQELSSRLHRDFKIGGERASKQHQALGSPRFTYRKAFVYVGMRLRGLSLIEFHPAIADLLILQAFSSFLFKNRSFNSYEQTVDIRECDLTVFQKYLENSQLRVEDEARVVNRQAKYALVT
jgi:hypothetical protein